MSNTITALAPILWADARLVPRELTGFIGSCDRNFSDQGVALNDVVKVPVSPIATVTTFTPAATFPAGTDRTLIAKTFTLAQSAGISWNMSAEQERSLENGAGPGFNNAVATLKQTIAQSTRAIVNTIEAYLGTIADKNFSRAYGTATTTPFASTIGDLAQVRKILVDNGAPMNDLSLIMDTTAGLNFRQLANLYKVNEAGGQDLLRDGALGRIYGCDLYESAQVKSHTAGTGTSYVVNGTHAIGATDIVIKTGSGTVLAGDSVTINSVKYGVLVGVAAAGTITIQEPGLLAAAADGDTVTIAATHRSNILMHRNAMCAVVRPALQPVGPWEQMVLSDPQTGLSFLLVRVPQDGQVSWFLRVVYDAFVPNGFAMAKLIG